MPGAVIGLIVMGAEQLGGSGSVGCWPPANAVEDKVSNKVMMIFMRGLLGSILSPYGRNKQCKQGQFLVVKVKLPLR